MSISEAKGSEVIHVELIDSILDAFARVGIDLRSWLSPEWLGVKLWQYLLAFIVIVLTLFARRFAMAMLNRLSPWIGKVAGVYAGRIIVTLAAPATAVVALIGITLAVRILVFQTDGAAQPVVSDAFLRESFEVGVAIIVIWIVMRFIDILAEYLEARAVENDLAVEVPIIPLLRKSLKIFVGVVGGLFVVQNMGYPIASILGGLGIGGLAVALAAQDTLANVFGSVIVFTDKPFKVGDWVQIGDVYGDVESIGFRSTRIRTMPQTVVTIPNSAIAANQVENCAKRKVSFTLVLDDESPIDKVQQVVRGIREILGEHPGVDQEYFLVNFTEFGSDGLGLFIYYFTRSPEWKEHLQVREDVNVGISKLLEELGVGLALPGTRVYIAPSSEMSIPELKAVGNEK